MLAQKPYPGYYSVQRMRGVLGQAHRVTRTLLCQHGGRLMRKLEKARKFVTETNEFLSRHMADVGSFGDGIRIAYPTRGYVNPSQKIVKTPTSWR